MNTKHQQCKDFSVCSCRDSLVNSAFMNSLYEKVGNPFFKEKHVFGWAQSPKSFLGNVCLCNLVIARPCFLTAGVWCLAANWRWSGVAAPYPQDLEAFHLLQNLPGLKMTRGALAALCGAQSLIFNKCSWKTLDVLMSQTRHHDLLEMCFYGWTRFASYITRCLLKR